MTTRSLPLAALALLALPLFADGLGGARPLARRGRQSFGVIADYGSAKWSSGSYRQIFSGGGVPFILDLRCESGAYEFADCESASRQTRFGFEAGYAFNDRVEITGRLGMADFRLDPSVNNVTPYGRVNDMTWGYDPFAGIGARVKLWERWGVAVGLTGRYSWIMNRKTTVAQPEPLDDPFFYGYGAKARLSHQMEAEVAIPVEYEFRMFRFYAGPYWSRARTNLDFSDPNSGEVFFSYALHSRGKVKAYGGLQAEFAENFTVRAEVQQRAGTRFDLALVYRY